MAINYGSSHYPTQLLPSQRGGVIKPPQKIVPKGWITVLRTLFTIAEIGLAFIPAIGVVGQTALGIGFGGLHQWLDQESGADSHLGRFLNFGVPFLAGSFTGLRNVKKFKAVQARALQPRLWNDPIFRKLTDIQKLRKINDLLSNATAYAKFSKGLPYKQIKYTGKFLQGTETGKTFFIPLTSTVPHQIIGGDHFAPGFFQNIEKFGIQDIFGKGIKGSVHIDSMGDLGKHLQRIGFTTTNINDIMHTIGNANLSQIGATRQLNKLHKILKNIGHTNASHSVKQFVTNFEKGFQKIAQLNAHIPQASITYRSLGDQFAGWTKVFNDKVIETPWHTKLSRYIATSEFNRVWVQRAQLIDPNDFGRAPIEALYQRLKKRIGLYFKKSKKALKHAQKAEDAFVKTGGINLNSSWILGIKIIKQEPFKSLILITFRPDATNNKRPVLVWSTRIQLKNFINSGSPGSYYLRTWAVSRGGRPVGLTGLFGGIGGISLATGSNAMVLHNFLAFIPVQSLRHILSIVSNWVENIKDIAQGNYLPNWSKKFIGSFGRTAISRTFRLFGKVIGGGFATQHFGKKIGDFIGRELQRAGTQIGATAIKNVAAGKPWDKTLSRKFFEGAAISVRSNTLRILRHKKGYNSVVVNILSGRRKLSHVKRIPNAVLPNRPFRGFKVKKPSRR